MMRAATRRILVPRPVRPILCSLASTDGRHACSRMIACLPSSRNMVDFRLTMLRCTQGVADGVTGRNAM